MNIHNAELFLLKIILSSIVNLSFYFYLCNENQLKNLSYEKNHLFFHSDVLWPIFG